MRKRWLHSMWRASDSSESSSFREDLRAISQNFPLRIPRYTSFPTAAELSTSFDSESVEHHLNRAFTGDRSISLYVHLPYCPKLCHFCACNKIISRSEEDRDNYVQLLGQELQMYRGLRGERIGQIHYGGGSPSYLSIEQLQRLDDIILQTGVTREIERSVEIDCRTIDPDKIRIFHQQGFRRFSLGVQDFDPRVQELVNRVQPFELIRDTCAEIRRHPQSTINFDLIYGLPGQSTESFRRTINSVVSLSPDRIALYGYAHVEDKVKVQKTFQKYDLPTPITRLEIFHQAMRTLQHSGYHYIGLDHFAKDSDQLTEALRNGTLRRNFMGYTCQTGETLLGIGISAISDTDDIIVQNHSKEPYYTSKLGDGCHPFARIIQRSIGDKIRAYCIESLMCKRRVSLSDVIQRFPGHEIVNKIFAQALNSLEPRVGKELAISSPSYIQVTERGSLFLRYIVSVFDNYLASKDSNIFSAAI